MSSAKGVASGFSITGLLDDSARTRGRFPVVEIEPGAISDHPANVAYSMDPAGIRDLAESIRESGLTDIPLVRKMDDGSWQMLSDHRRKAAYSLLAEEDLAFSRMPCRVVEDIDDVRALTLLHSANYFVRALTVSERAAATEALGVEARRLRREDPVYAGRRTADIKAELIEAQTGRKVSGKTILREERLARRIAEELSPEWAAEADRGNLSAETVDALCAMGRREQSDLYRHKGRGCTSKRDISEYVRQATGEHHAADKRLLKAAQLLESYLEKPPRSIGRFDLEQLRLIRDMTTRLGSPGPRAGTGTG